MASRVCTRPRARRRQAAEHSIADIVALTFLVLLVVPTWGVAGQRPDCREKPSHTLCRQPHPACVHKKKGVDVAARAEILKVHNDYRSQVALGKLPGFQPAADMQELIWDDELAEVAQAHTELCTDTQGLGELKHDRYVDRTTAKFTGVGQNIGDVMGDYQFQQNWTARITAWFKEYKDYPPNRIAAYQYSQDGPKTGHFTHVIWAQTRYVGCGFLHYYVPGSKYTDIMLYTCNYGPTGNVLRSPVYQEGATCSACPASTVCNPSTGLCGGSGGGSPDSQIDDSPSSSWLFVVAGLVSALAVGAAFIAYFYCRYRASEDRNEAQPAPGAMTTGGFQSSTSGLLLTLRSLQRTGYDVEKTKVFIP